MYYKPLSNENTGLPDNLPFKKPLFSAFFNKNLTFLPHLAAMWVKKYLPLSPNTEFMHPKIILDEIDTLIIRELTNDAEKPFIQIAKSLNISNSLVHQRVSRLKQLGVIERTEVKLSEKHLGYESCAFSGLILSEDQQSAKVIELLKKIPEIVECYYISGKYTLYVKIVACNNDHLREILYEKINSIKWITRTETFINFGTAFKRNPPTPDELQTKS